MKKFTEVELISKAKYAIKLLDNANMILDKLFFKHIRYELEQEKQNG